MARLHVVTKNRAGKKIKCDVCPHVIKAGETYYYWTNRTGRVSMKRIRCSSHKPRPSDMTQSEHKRVAYSAQERIEDACNDARSDYDLDSLTSTLEDVASDLESYVSEIEDRISNMEDKFPQRLPVA